MKAYVLGLALALAMVLLADASCLVPGAPDLVLGMVGCR